MGDKLHRREGNSPDRRLRSRRRAQWERKWDSPDSREVGLEAAILERVRNSSPVEGFCAENVAGLSPPPKPRNPSPRGRVGRGASPGR